MSSPEEKDRHRKRLKRKIREKKTRVKSPIAKALEDPLFHQRVVKDKRGKSHNLGKMKFIDLVEAIKE